jgi:hypothetical protein
MSNGFSVTITAVDRATKSIDNVNKRLAAMMAPVTRLQKAFGKFGDLTGINALGRGLASLASFAARAGRSLLSIVAPLGAITSAISIAGMARMAETWSSFAQRLGFDATRIGIAAGQLHALQGAARLAGASGEALTSGMRNLNDTLTEAAGGRNAEAVVMFRTLGVEFTTMNGTARRAVDVLPDVANAIARIRNPALQARAATSLFGGAAEDLLPFLRKGAAGLKEYTELARRYGVITEDGTRIAGAMREAQTRLSLSWEGLGNVVSQRVAPVLTDLFTFMAEWLLRNRDRIVAIVDAVAKAFSNWAKNGGMDRLLALVDRIATKVANMTMPTWLQKMLGVSDDQGSGAGGGSVGAGDNPYADWPSIVPNSVNGFSSVPNDFGLPQYQAPPEATNLSKNGKAKAIFDQLVGLGWTQAAAAGAVANFDRESGFDEMQVGDNGRAYGLGQWHPDRQANFQRVIGRPIQGSSLADQVRFFDWEARGGDKQFAAINAPSITSPSVAGRQISAAGERPADRIGEAMIREGMAREWYTSLTRGGDPSAGGIFVPGAWPAPGAQNAGTVKVEIVNKNAPPGTTMRTTTTGPVQASARVETAMPSAGSEP